MPSGGLLVNVSWSQNSDGQALPFLLVQSGSKTGPETHGQEGATGKQLQSEQSYPRGPFCHNDQEAQQFVGMFNGDCPTNNANLAVLLGSLIWPKGAKHTLKSMYSSLFLLAIHIHSPPCPTGDVAKASQYFVPMARAIIKAQQPMGWWYQPCC